jgi:hypothetical protein
MSQFIFSSNTSYENKILSLENNLRSINNNYYNGVTSNSMDKYMYYSSLSNTCSSENSSSSSHGRSMSREPNYTVGQWSIEGVL